MDREKAGFLIAAGEALTAFCQTLKDSPLRPRLSDCQTMLDLLKRFFLMSARGGVAMKPKHHLMLHVPKRALNDGHPSLHATWFDETMNRPPVSIGADAHRMVWPLRVLA